MADTAMTPGPEPEPGARTAAPGRARAAWLRAVLFTGFWLLLARPWAGQNQAAVLADLAVGALAVGLATWASLGLLPPTGHRLRLGGLVRFGAHFLLQSFLGGLDVARRAFAPRLSLAPGYLDYPTGLRPGPGRAAFGALTSLVPGTLPVETDRPGALVYHGLDLRAPVAAGLARDEAMMRRVWVPADDGHALDD